MASNLLLSVYTFRTAKTQTNMGLLDPFPKGHCMAIIALGIIGGELHEFMVLVFLRVLWWAFSDVVMA